MREIKTEDEYQKAAEEVFYLMNKGEGNLTAAENGKVRRMALAIQAYEQEKYPPANPKNFTT